MTKTLLFASAPGVLHGQQAAADYLGVSVRTVRKMVARKSIRSTNRPGLKRGKGVRSIFYKADLDYAVSKTANIPRP